MSSDQDRKDRHVWQWTDTTRPDPDMYIPAWKIAELHDDHRGLFRWRWPRFMTNRAAAPRRWRVGLNRYPRVVVGAWVQLGGRVFGVTWKGSKS